MVQDPRNFNFNSDYQMPVVAFQKEFTITTTGRGSATTKIKHNLPFAPLVLGKFSTTSDFSVSQEIGTGAYLDNSMVWAFADSEYIYCNSLCSGPITRYVKIVGLIPPDYNGAAIGIETDTNYKLDTDNEYIGCIQGVANVTVDGLNSLIVRHGFGYCPQSKVWIVTDSYEYIGNYVYGESGERVLVNNVTAEYTSSVDMELDGTYDLSASTTEDFLCISGIYNPNDGSITPPGSTSLTTAYYHIYTEEA